MERGFVNLTWSYPPPYFYLLMLSVFCLWTRPKLRLSVPIFSIALIWALLDGRMDPYLSLLQILFFILYWRAFRVTKWETLIQLLIAIPLILLKLHLLQGIQNWPVFLGQKLSHFGAQASFWLNFETPFIALLVLGFDPKMKFLKPNQVLELFRKTYRTLILVLFTLLGSASALNQVRFEPKWFEITPLWLGAQLFFTCVGEEALFRQLIQNRLVGWVGGQWGWILSSLFFGFSHFSQGFVSILLATVAGFFYGHAYRVTGRVEGAILTHFFVNAIHFLFFSYPALQH